VLPSGEPRGKEPKTNIPARVTVAEMRSARGGKTKSKNGPGLTEKMETLPDLRSRRDPDPKGGLVRSERKAYTRILTRKTMANEENVEDVHTGELEERGRGMSGGKKAISSRPWNESLFKQTFSCVCKKGSENISILEPNFTRLINKGR